MHGVKKQFANIGVFNDLTGIHYGDPLGHLRHDSEIMGDQEDGCVEICFQIVHEIQDLSLNRDIQRGCGFIGDDQVRIAGQGHCYHHPLPHAATHLIGIFSNPLAWIGYADVGQQFSCPAPGRPSLQAFMQLEHLCNLVAYLKGRIEGGHGLLENHGDSVATDVPDFRVTQPDHIPPVEQNSAVNNFAGGIRDQSHDRQCGYALSAPGLPDQAQRFTAFNFQVHTVDSFYDPAVGDKGGSEIFNPEQRLVFHC